MNSQTPSNSPIARNCRAACAQAIYRVVYHSCQLDRALREEVTDYDRNDQAFIREIVLGVLREFWRLGAWTDHILKQTPRKKDRDVYCLLLVGIYQIEYMRVPDYAAVSETVSAAEALAKPWARKLINAVLRKFVAHCEQIKKADLNDSARFSHPQWMIELVKAQWPDEYREILNANNRKPELILRVNSTRSSVESYLRRLEQNNIAASADRVAPQGVRIHERVTVSELPGFAQGVVSVQNSASQLAVSSLDITSGDRVLDACSAPGGKLMHMLEDYSETCEIAAIDISEARCAQIVDNLGRVDGSVKIMTADATQPDKWWDGVPYNRILLDAPCSAFGVVSKHPEIKFHRKPNDILSVSLLQKKLLGTLFELLDKGGKLLYTTCSILREENDDVIGEAIKDHPDMRVVELDQSLGRKTCFGRQRLQGIDFSDGFYYALLTRL